MRFTRQLLGALLLALSLSQLALAYSTVDCQVTPTQVGGKPAARLVGAAGSTSPFTLLTLVQSDYVPDPLATAREACARLNTRLCKAPAAKTPTVQLAGARLIVGEASAPLFSFDAKHAYKTGSTPEALVKQWNASLKKLFALPRLATDKDSLLVPVGESRDLTVLWTGASSSPLSLEANQPGLETTISGSTAWIKAITTGDWELALVAEGKRLVIPVKGRYWAAQLVSAPQARVTSYDLASEVLRLAGISALWEKLVRRPEATTSLGATSLRSGSLVMNVQTDITGANLIPFSRDVEIAFSRQQAPLSTPPDRLYISNSPESVSQPQVLCAARLEPGSNSRLLYHHRSISSKPLYFEMSLENPGSEPVSVFLKSRAAGPSKHEAFAGHVAASAALADAFQQRGAFITIPAGGAVSFGRIKTTQGLTSSAVAEVALLSGGPLYWLTSALESAPVPSWQPRASKPLATLERWKLAPSYPALLETTFEADLSGKWLFVPIGGANVKGSDDSTLLMGDYGVLHRIQITLTNSLPNATEVEVMHYAGAGYCTATYSLQGVFAELPGCQGSTQTPVARFTMPANSSRQLTIYTMPESGSHYPATLILRKAQ